MTLPILQDWYIAELTSFHVFGRIYNDPNTFPGTDIQTEPIINIDTDKRLLFTTGKTYKLGKPDPVWVSTREK